MIPLATSLEEIARPYRALFVDIWGVVHDGVAAFKSAGRALRQAREAGKAVILISNAPRLSSEIPAQFARIGVDPGIHDAIVTSGDTARAIIGRWAGGGTLRLHHIGPERHLSVFEGLAIERVGVGQASHVVCTGLVDDETETPDDYMPLLEDIAARGLAFLCANPDHVVQRGDKLIYCAGALAERLERLGREVIYSGKPYAPIYELALERAGRALGRALAKREILAIGDGLRTDMLGAERFGVASLFIASGIHAGEVMNASELDPERVRAACAAAGVHPIAVMRTLEP
jgi:HAD superfamily hydrolase (TIGR01459 family)